MKSNKNNLPWEQESKPRQIRFGTLVSIMASVICILCLAAVVVSNSINDAKPASDASPDSSYGVSDPTQDPAYQGYAPVGGGMNIEDIDYCKEAKIEQATDGETWCAMVQIDGIKARIIFPEDPGTVRYNPNCWIISTESRGYVNLKDYMQDNAA